MIEIRIHGRGGQGSVKAAEILAMAAFKDGKFSQAFPFIGTEIRGASVEAYCRISDNEIKTREHIYNPDYVLLLDSTLFGENILKGIKKGIVINSKDKQKISVDKKIILYVLDLTKIALDTIGKPFLNMPMLGAFAAVTELVSLKSIVSAVQERFDEKTAELNVAAVNKAYSEMKEKLK